nr:MAG TPA: hypothetical protein [Caudoviricetes sp.]
MRNDKPLASIMDRYVLMLGFFYLLNILISVTIDYGYSKTVIF